MLQEPRLHKASCTAAFCLGVLSGAHHEELATFPDSKNKIWLIIVYYYIDNYVFNGGVAN